MTSGLLLMLAVTLASQISPTEIGFLWLIGNVIGLCLRLPVESIKALLGVLQLSSVPHARCCTFLFTRFTCCTIGVHMCVCTAAATIWEDPLCNYTMDISTPIACQM